MARLSEIAGYVNHHAYNVSVLALPFLSLSCYPALMQMIIVFQPLQSSDGQYPHVIPPF